MKNERNCPICQQTMMTRVSHGVEIDLCGACGGLWLDAGELDALLSGRFDVGGMETEFDATVKLPTLCRYCNIEHADGRVDCRNCSRSLGIGCPVDGRGMHIVRFGALEFDRCSSCRGIWVDGFEREALGEQAKSIQRERAAVFVIPASADDWSSNSNWGIDVEEKKSQKRTPVTGVDVECSGCHVKMNRYSAWAYEDEFWCLRCAEHSEVKSKLQASVELQRAMHQSAQQRLPDDGGTWNTSYGYRRRHDLYYIGGGYELLAGLLSALFRGRRD